MNKAAQELGRLGGKKSSEAKAEAARSNIRAFWEDVRAGNLPAPKHKKKAKK